MKTSKIMAGISIGVMLFASCKKQEDTPAATTPPVTPVTLTAAVGGSNVSGTYISWSTSGNLKNVNWALANNNSIGFTSTQPVAGTYSLSFTGNQFFSMYYNGKNFSSKTGTVNITQIDTVADKHIKTLKATFSFNTDTVSGVSYSVSNGVINWTE